MKKISGYFKGEKKIILFIVLMVISTIMNVVEPYLTSQLVDALTMQKLHEMFIFAIVIAVIAMILAFLRYISSIIAVNVKNNVSKRLEKDLCSKALNIKGKYINEFKSGELTSITKENPAEMVRDIGDIIKSSLGVTAAIAVACYVAYLNIYFFLLYLAFFCTVYVYQINSLKREKKNTDTKKEKNDSAKSLVNQIYRGLTDIKVLNLKGVVFQRYIDLMDSEIECEKEKNKARESNRLFCNMAFQVYTFAFFILGIILLANNMLTISTFITVYLYRSYMYSLLFDVVEMRSNLVEVKSLAERIDKILSIDDEKLEKFGEINGSKSDKHSIEVTGLSFSYGDGELLNDINLKIHQGEIVGLVGASGSAKTTLIKLIARQLEPCRGQIKVDGIDINKYSEKGFTDMISMASQHPFIFACSIRENLLMIKPNATEGEMWSSLEKARIIGWVKSLKYGLDTILTENLNLSGGQLQRLSLARLFLKNTPIIIFDEATSALDNRTQAEITEAIRKEASRHIVIIIAHRIEAVENADRILFMSNGVIADEGSHEELLSRNPEYRLLTAKEN